MLKSISSTFWKRELAVILLLVVVVLLFRLPFTIQPYDNDSSAFTYHARLILAGDPLYGSHHPGHHLPGIIYTYVLAYKLLGESAAALQIFLIPWTVLAAYLIYRIGIYMGSPKIGLLGGCFYAIVNTSLLMKGGTGEIEVFANLPRTACVWLASWAIHNRRGIGSLFLVGILAGISFQYKAAYVSPFVIAACLAAADAWLHRSDGHWLRRAGLRLAALAAGFASVMGVVMLYFGSLGLLSRLMLVFTLGASYTREGVSWMGVLTILLAPIAVFYLNNLPIFLLGLAGIIYAAADSLEKIRSSGQVGLENLTQMSILAWLLASFVEASLSSVGRDHYYLLLLPSLSLLAAWMVKKIYQVLSRRSVRLAALTAIAVCGLVVAANIKVNFPMDAHFLRYSLGLEGYEDNIVYKNYVVARKLADYIKPRTTPDDYVFYYSDNWVFYTLVDRRVPIEFPWIIYTEAFGPVRRIFEPQTRYIIISKKYPPETPQFSWLMPELERSYTLETTIDGELVYRHNP